MTVTDPNEVRLALTGLRDGITQMIDETRELKRVVAVYKRALKQMILAHPEQRLMVPYSTAEVAKLDERVPVYWVNEGGGGGEFTLEDPHFFE